MTTGVRSPAFKIVMSGGTIAAVAEHQMSSNAPVLVNNDNLTGLGHS